MDQIAQATAGGAAGVVAVAALYPLVLVKTRLQAQRKKKVVVDEDDEHHYDGPVDCLMKVLKYEGIRGLFKGVSSFLPKAFATNFIFYFVHAALKPIFKVKSFMNNMIHGIIAGAVVQIIMTPFELVNTRVVIDKTGKTKFVETFKALLKQHGFMWFYDGIGPQLMLTLNPGITNVVRQKLDAIFVSSSHSAAKDFWIGAGSKAVASFTTYPLVVCKVHMHTKHLDEPEIDDSASEDDVQVLDADKVGKSTDSKVPRPDTIFTVAKRIAAAHGVMGFYKGLETQLGTAVLKEAILNMCRKEIYHVIMMVFGQHKQVK